MINDIIIFNPDDLEKIKTSKYYSHLEDIQLDKIFRLKSEEHEGQEKVTVSYDGPENKKLRKVFFLPLETNNQDIIEESDEEEIEIPKKRTEKQIRDWNRFGNKVNKSEATYLKDTKGGAYDFAYEVAPSVNLDIKDKNMKFKDRKQLKFYDDLAKARKQNYRGDYYEENSHRNNGNRYRRQRSYTAFIRNLSYDTSYDDLYSIFPKDLEIAKLSIPQKNDTGRGFAFVDLHSRDDLEYFIEKVNNTPLKHMIISVTPKS